MTKNTEEMILQELFSLNHKIDRFQDDVRTQISDLNLRLKTVEETMVTKNDLAETKKELEQRMDKMVTKEEFEKRMEKMVTKEEFKKEMEKMVTKEEFKKEMDVQADDIAQIFHNTFKTLEKREKQLQLKILK